MWAVALWAWGRGPGTLPLLITCQELALTQGYLDGPLPQGRGLWGSPSRSREYGPWGSCVLKTLGAQAEPQVVVRVLLLWWGWGLCVCLPGHDLVCVLQAGVRGAAAEEHV